jgi:hypothetical protein
LEASVVAAPSAAVAAVAAAMKEVDPPGERAVDAFPCFPTG